MTLGDEVLRVMFWVREEGFASALSVEELERFFGHEHDIGGILHTMTEQGLTLPQGPSYRLTETGAKRAAAFLGL